jgi:hypothetical protein
VNHLLSFRLGEFDVWRGEEELEEWLGGRICITFSVVGVVEGLSEIFELEMFRIMRR